MDATESVMHCSCGAAINPRFRFRTCTRCALDENARDCADWRRERAAASRARLMAAGLIKGMDENVGRGANPDGVDGREEPTK